MLKKLEMTCFRKVEHDVMVFNDGLVVVRGRNEASKSTRIEAVLYALFGSSALRNSLADTVTWGRKESDLKVDLTIEVEGQLYRFTRSKSGAECAYSGGLVTGQKEVTNFAAEIVGADEKTASRLMMANQASLRGVLEEGPKAMSMMIEDLSGLDLFDRILDAAEHKLLTGSTAVFEEKVKEAELALAEAEPQPLDTDVFASQQSSLTADTVRNEESIEALAEQKSTADTALHSAEQVKRMREMLERNHAKAVEDLKLARVQKADAEAKAKATINEAELAQLKQDLADIDTAMRRQAVANDLGKLMATYPEAHWEGSKESFTEETERVERAINQTESELKAENEVLKGLQKEEWQVSRGIVTSLTCPTCGQDIKDKAKVEARNAAIRAEVVSIGKRIKDTEKEVAAYEDKIKSLKEELNELRAVAKAAAPFEKFATTHGEFVLVDFTFFPPKLSWKGGDQPTRALPDAKSLKERIVSLEGAKEASERANARSIALAETIESGEGSVARLKQQLDECAATPDIDSLKETSRGLGNQIALLKEHIAAARRRIDEISDEIQKARVAYQTAIERRKAAASKLEQARKDLDQLNFNNALIKKIRAARPLIADKLWESVLQSVSVMFSQMRGEQSIVSKTKDGFRVNGESVQSLSGSTLDLLALALRSSLCKVFLPYISFMVLDEPAAAMDDERATAMLGFIAGLGMKQVLLITHEEVSETFADQVIHI